MLVSCQFLDWWTWPFPFPFLLASFSLGTCGHSISYSVSDLVGILHCFLCEAKVPRHILLTAMPAKTLLVSLVNIHWSRCAGSCIHAGIGGIGGGVGRLGCCLQHHLGWSLCRLLIATGSELVKLFFEVFDEDCHLWGSLMVSGMISWLNICQRVLSLSPL